MRHKKGRKTLIEKFIDSEGKQKDREKNSYRTIHMHKGRKKEKERKKYGKQKYRWRKKGREITARNLVIKRCRIIGAFQFREILSINIFFGVIFSKFFLTFLAVFV
jgi:hypothetical protein